MSDEEIEKMAEYSASVYAKTQSEKAHYLTYYRNYYKNGGDAKATGNKQAGDSTSSTKAKDFFNFCRYVLKSFFFFLLK